MQRLHEKHGVRFHLGTKPVAIDERSVTLANGERLPADLVVVGIGVRPATGTGGTGRARRGPRRPRERVPRDERARHLRRRRHRALAGSR